MVISVICPIYNEASYLPGILAFFQHSEPLEKELLLIDGGSTDGSLELILQFQQDFNNIHLINNPDKYVPFGLNKAIPMCKGEFIARIDAHAEYPADYFQACLKAIRKTGAENVGGAIHSEGEGPVGQAIACAMSSQFGVGNVSFRTMKTDAYVDTVPFGFWKRDIFNRFGLFDEKLIRNQDDEFNYRILKRGGKIFQSSEIHCRYFVRPSFKSLFKQYYQYGLYKPLVIKKIGKVVKLRHLVPVLFAFYLLILPLSFFFIYLLIPAVIYIFSSLFFALRCKANTILIMIAFFILHFSYGMGFLHGLIKFGKN